MARENQTIHLFDHPPDHHSNNPTPHKSYLTSFNSLKMTTCQNLQGVGWRHFAVLFPNATWFFIYFSSFSFSFSPSKKKKKKTLKKQKYFFLSSKKKNLSQKKNQKEPKEQWLLL